MKKDAEKPISFHDLSLIPPVLKALDHVGYETPSPIQAQTIPHLLSGEDVLGQAQTGTGKTAAFALPILSRIKLKQTDPQVLVLAPTRELAIQVAEAFQKYAAQMKGFHVLPIYGGQDYKTQLRGIKRGVHVVVGTPGRVMDHMRRGTLKVDKLSCLVLDEADEMLRMGFIDDVEWILEQTPKTRQIALFSATMPNVIKRIAKKYLKDPEEITINVRITAADTIRQRYWMVSGLHKLDALTRILETEDFDGVIIFVRTKTATVELADKLEARGYATAALNGDIQQKQRERTVTELKSGKLDILVATDVAARGLDVKRISHVINFDIPYDTEAYVHRIGRTGRAGREGDAILFVAPRERRMLRAIEKATKKSIDIMELPSTDDINDKRISRFTQKITDTLANEELGFFQQLLEKYELEHNVPAIEVAAALAKLAQGNTPLLLKNKPKKETLSKTDREKRKSKENKSREKKSREHQDSPRGRSNEASRDRSREKPKSNERNRTERKSTKRPDAGMERFRIEVGHSHDVEPRNIVGAIANEAGLDSEHIGRIDIQDDHSFVDLPEDMPRDIFRALGKAWVGGQQLKISRTEGKRSENRKKSFEKKDKPKRSKKPAARKKSKQKPKNKNKKKVKE